MKPLINLLFSIIAFLTILTTNSFSLSLADSLNYSELASYPILEGGRMKPLEAFAGKAMETITGRWSFKGKDPLVYLTAIVTSPDWANEKMILVDYKPVKIALSLDADLKYFSYNELASNPQFSQLSQAIHQKSLSGEQLTTVENRIATVLERLQMLDAVSSGDILTLVPPPPGSPETADWLPITAPTGYPQEKIDLIKSQWIQLLESVKQKNTQSFGTASKQLKQTLASLNPTVFPPEIKMAREINYYHTRPFLKAWIFYLLAFVVFLVSFYYSNKITIGSGCGLFILGYLFNSYGLVMRSVIAGHPSVANMYETVIFACWGVITIALIFELIYRQRWFLTIASLLGAVLILFADLMPFDSNIEPLVPVLRSNYWLTIHVMTIMLSYSAFSLALGLAHVILSMYFRKSPNTAVIQNLSNFLYRILQVGVILLTAGTILGGVWAAEAWGRFWGWDPKETWALITLLGYLSILHARYINWVKHIGTAIGAILAFWLVVMTWYGVNFVLGQGKHAYGAGSGGGWYVLGFLLLESIFILAFCVRYYFPPIQQPKA